jgi:hypothetical protein
LLSDFTHNEADGFTATNAIATAADKSVPATAKRTAEAKRFRLNECGVFIYLEMLIEVEPLSSLGSSDSELKEDRQEFLVLHFCNVESVFVPVEVHLRNTLVYRLPL